MNNVPKDLEITVNKKKGDIYTCIPTIIALFALFFLIQYLPVIVNN